MADYHALIANCPIGGELYSPTPEGEVLNLIRLHVGGFDIELHQVPQFILKYAINYAGLTMHTTDLYIRNLRPEHFHLAECIAQEVAELLSFATMSDACCYGYEFSDVKPIAQQRAVLGEMRCFRPLFDTRNGASVRQLLETTFPTYHSLRVQRKLNIAVSYYLLAAKGDLPIEAYLVFLFVLLEHLKHTYGLEQGYLWVNHGFRHKPGGPHPSGSRVTFNQMLSAMFGAVGMAPPLSSLVALRNELIHSGMSQLSLSAKRDMWYATHDIVREYFLKLLGYKGMYYDFSKGAQHTL
jgi:hypothetical protein